MTLDEFLKCLDDVRPVSDGWFAVCPAGGFGHVLQIHTSGRVRCRSGCQDSNVREALAARGINYPAQVPPTLEIASPSGTETPHAHSAAVAGGPAAPIPADAQARPSGPVVKPRRSDLEQEIRRLHGEGLTNREIARRVQMHHTSVGRVLRQPQGGLV